MDALQTSYSENMARFAEGFIPDQRSPGMDVSRIVETVAGLGFGKVAVQGTNEKQIRVSEAGRPFVGVTVMDTTQLQDSYLRYAIAHVRTKGPVVVATSVAVNPGDPAYYVPATGVFTNVSGGNTLVGKFETKTTAAGQLAVLNLT